MSQAITMRFGGEAGVSSTTPRAGTPASLNARALRSAFSSNELFGIPAGQLLDAGNDDLELDPQLLAGSPAAAETRMRA